MLAAAKITTRGFQLISWTFRIVCATICGTAAVRRTSAPDARSDTICESTVGSVDSYAVCRRRDDKASGPDFRSAAPRGRRLVQVLTAA
jgi:hypothetical protein